VGGTQGPPGSDPQSRVLASVAQLAYQAGLAGQRVQGREIADPAVAVQARISSNAISPCRLPRFIAISRRIRSAVKCFSEASR